MNIQQFKYILAVAELQHFEQAAEKCFVTQSTLSTMIGKFEQEIGLKIFDRKTKPVSITKEGQAIISQLQILSKELGRLEDKVQELKGESTGQLAIGVIPTIAPFLLPLFLSDFAKKIPEIKINVQEMTTHKIIESLKTRAIDIGVAALPLEETDLLEHELYNEPFLLFDCHSKKQSGQAVKIDRLDLSHLLLLEEGHCLRTQAKQICNLSKEEVNNDLNFDFKAGSIDSLIRFTKVLKGVTLLPQLATIDLSEEELRSVKRFLPPVPIRSVGLIVHKHFVKDQILEDLKKMIQKVVLPKLSNNKKERLVKPLESEFLS